MDGNKSYRYINDKSILVITAKGEIKRLYCPFFVVYRYNGKTLRVDALATDEDWIIFYKINSVYLRYNKFSIVYNR